jgi:[CysO sulfur-carrier protein]-S-L-cysteine hydrolase
LNQESTNRESSNRESPNHESANRESVRILQSVIDALVDHARRDSPIECCGLLAARDGVIDESIPTRNLKASPVVFLIDPADHFAALKRTRAEGREIVGAYHSHPRSPAVPSATDLAEAHYEEFLYVIVSLAGAEPEVRAFRLVPAARFEELRFQIRD